MLVLTRELDEDVIVDLRPLAMVMQKLAEQIQGDGENVPLDLDDKEQDLFDQMVESLQEGNTDQGLVTIKVTDVRGDKVRIGFKAPRAMDVDRREIFDSKEEERKRVAKVRSTLKTRRIA